jgi:sterol desaturase/sphingolipid hydroxylase (fatty acid hydroxylase superfamily)
MKTRASNRWLDIVYWVFVTPFISGMLTRLATLGAVALLATAVSRPTLSLGFWVEILPALVLADVAGYWSHRLRHSRFLWPFHAIHHSPTKLDAIAAARMHPIDDLLDNTWVGVVLFVAGFSPQVIFAVGPILFAHIALTHADRSWDFGPLRKILVSPAQHRAHHEVGADHNFAGMFSFIDVLFGTYKVGNGGAHGSGEPIPERLFDHLVWPARTLRQRLSRTTE